MKAFTVREIRTRSEILIDETRAGSLAVVSRHGKPAFVAVPFDEQLLDAGVHVALAVKLYRDDVLDLAKAARLARMPLTDFISELDQLGIAAVRYAPGDFDQEIAAFDDG